MTVDIDYEKIAAQIHQFYCDQAIAQGWTNDFPFPFAELPEFMKADNRAAARRIGRVLSLAGLRIVPRNGQPWPPAEQSEMLNLIEQNIDLLGEGEHDGWTQARLREGWRLAPCKDTAKRESHLLVPWSQFPVHVKQKQEHEQAHGRPPKKGVEQEVKDEMNKDRDSVRNYVSIIAKTEYRIAREER
jgi:hypothetical protein